MKAAVILGYADLQGKAYLTCMAQHNGECGCLTCEEPGMVVQQDRSPTEAAPKCTNESFLTNGIAAHRSNKRVRYV